MYKHTTLIARCWSPVTYCTCSTRALKPYSVCYRSQWRDLHLQLHRQQPIRLVLVGYHFSSAPAYSHRWHAHYSNTLADGLVGGLIIHSPNDPLKLGQDFDEERVLYVSDWV